MKNRDLDSAVVYYQQYFDFEEKPAVEDLLKLGKCYYNLACQDSVPELQKEELIKADSLFKELSFQVPNSYVSYFWRARVNSMLDPETTKGLAKPYYEKVIEIGLVQPERYKRELIESYKYLGYYHYVIADAITTKNNGNPDLAKEEYGEAGLSSGNVSGTGLSEKMEKDETFWKKEAPDYCFQSLYLQNEDELGDALECEELDGIRTIVTRESQTSDEPIVSFAGEEVTLQRATGDGVNHTFMDDFRQRCIQTALGYSNTVWDLLAAAYPEKKDDAWEILSKEAASNICTYQKPFTAFDETTISKSDQRIRRFLALSYSAESEDNMISLHVDGLEKEAWFLLHTGTCEAEDIQGGSFSVVEDGVYLICAEEDEVKIRLSEEEEKQLFYYED